MLIQSIINKGFFMELLDNEQQSKFQTFSCGNAKVTFDDNGYVVKVKDF